MGTKLRIAALALSAFGVGCDYLGPENLQPLKLAGGKEVPTETIKDGYDAYMQYCRPCHGDKGDGHGYSAYALRPPPRDFTQGLFKFGGVPAPALPPDSELIRIVKGGLHGTAMLPWDITDAELEATLQYIKTFSPRWATEAPGEVVKGTDPNLDGPAKAQAIERGKKLFHAKAQCSAACHPNFVTHEELFQLKKEQTGEEQTEFSPDMYVGKLKESEYCQEWKPGWKKLEDRECAMVKGEDGQDHPKVAKVMPPDFLRDDVRAGVTPADLFRTIGSGIGGAGMPPWKGALTDEEIWSLAYYVRSLVDLKGTPAGAALRASLDNPANLSWVPPKKEEAPPAPGTVAPGAPAAPGAKPAAPGAKPAAPAVGAKPAAAPHPAAPAAKPAVPGRPAGAAPARRLPPVKRGAK